MPKRVAGCISSPNVEIRRYVKEGDDTEEDDATARQLELWPQRHRSMVADIDPARVYVPSRGEFVPLEPDTLTPEEAKEAGEFLIAKGQHCVRIGRRLVTLGEMGWVPHTRMPAAASRGVAGRERGAE